MERSLFNYANVMSTIAVFIALSAGSYAAVKLPKNSVGATQIKKNAVTSAKIKSNSVTGAKVKKGSLKGSDIQLSSLGKVPGAELADRATTADDSALRAVKYSPITATAASYSAARDAAAAVPLLSYGHVTVYGKCFYDSSADRVEGHVFPDSNTEGGFFAASSDGEYAGALGPSIGENARWLTGTSASSGSYRVYSDWGSGLVLGPDGKGMQVTNTVVVHNGSSEVAGALPDSQSCLYSSTGQKVSR